MQIVTEYSLCAWQSASHFSMYYCFEIKRLPKLSASRWLDESSFGEKGFMYGWVHRRGPCREAAFEAEGNRETSKWERFPWQCFPQRRELTWETDLRKEGLCLRWAQKHCCEPSTVLLGAYHLLCLALRALPLQFGGPLSSEGGDDGVRSIDVASDSWEGNMVKTGDSGLRQ